MPRGASPKREKEYNELKGKFKKEGRYKGREKEVAARIVNQQRSQYGETKAKKNKDRDGKSSDRGLPINDYQHLTSNQVGQELGSLSKQDTRKIKQFDEKHKNRKSVLARIDRKMKE
jgi:hypothetical protein